MTPLLPADPAPSGGLLVAPAPHEFAAEDGLELSGWLYRPRGVFGAVPTLLWLHGGPEAQERPVFQPLFQALLAAGVAVFAPNVRGSSGSGRTFSQADDHERRFAAITDVRAAVGSLVAAARTEPWIATAATTKYGDPGLDAALLRSLSPIHRCDRITAPLLVVHGTEDTNVPLHESRRLVDALRARGSATRLLLFDNEGHDVLGAANRVLFVREVVGWVTGHLAALAERTG